jgi:pilus assembly protein TadC
MAERAFLQLMPEHASIDFGKKVKPLAAFIANMFPQLETDLKKANISLRAQQYIAQGMLSYLFLAGFLSFVIFYVFFESGIAIPRAVVGGGGIGFLVFFGIVYLAVKHPAGVAKERSVEIEKYLLYAIRDISLHISSGSTIYDAIREASESNYGEASKELEIVSRKIHLGIPIQKVLHERIEVNDSEFMRKVYWQMINAVEVGTDLRESLKSIIRELDTKQKAHIENYARELSLWSLVYMMFAVAIPTIGLTMMVILASFAGLGLNETSFILFLILSFIFQIGLIWFVKKRRPVVEF